MEHRTIILGRTLLASSLALCATACDDNGAEIGQSRAALVAECTSAEQASQLPADAWLCPETRTVECTSGNGTADVDILHVPDSTEIACADDTLTVSDAGPFAVGEHDITVSNEAGDEVCATTLTVTDTVAPVAESHTIQLWPPNHKFHSIAVEDCVSFVDACDGELKGEFIWASSDEPVDDLGDGHHAPDIQIDDCGHVSVRAERAGPKDGRVYRLGVRVVDGNGQTTEGECAVIVDHDQRGVQGADDGESYRLTFDGKGGGLTCDGESDDPPAPPADEGGDGGAGDNGGEVPVEPPPPPPPGTVI